MKKTKYCAPEAEVLRIVIGQSVLAVSGETEMNVGVSVDGYGTPTEDYDKEWD